MANGSAKLPSLTGDDFALLAQRRRDATRALEQARDRFRLGQTRAKAQHRLDETRIRDEAGQRTRDLMSTLGGRGLARQPRFAGAGTREIRNDAADVLAESRFDLADSLGGLRGMFQAARRLRDQRLADLSAEAVRRRVDFDRMWGS